MRIAILILLMAFPMIVFQNCSGFTALSGSSSAVDAVSGATTTVSTLSFSNSLINSAHRYEAGEMYGGWGPHLGHLLRSSENEMWFVDDSGNNVDVNAGLVYFHYVNGSWVSVVSQAFPGTVQQNTGSVMSGNMIYTYGVDTADERVIECYFDTSNATYSFHACNDVPFNTGASSNYIGATISKSGARVVWWTNTTGTFSYIYNFGGGWNGPITSNLPGYTDLSYVYARLHADNSNIDFLGAAAHAQGGASVGYDVLYASTTLGNAISNWQLITSNGTGSETWIDPSDGTHFITYSDTTSTAEYFYKPAGSTVLSGYSLPYTGLVSARIIETATTVNLVASLSDGTVKYKTLNLANISGAIGWSSLPDNNVSVPSGLGSITIFPESAMYQTNSPQALDFAINGEINQADVYFVQGK